MSILRSHRWSASHFISLPHLARGGRWRRGRDECLRLQDRQNRRELLWMVLSALIDVIVKHVSLPRNVTNILDAPANQEATAWIDNP